jgi:NAD(P)-dependent dehydrogenase (short-subunit alcohol dehydrogenase family)
MSGKLYGKTALITGGSGGIGHATALLFANEGAAVSIVDMNRELGEDVAREISAAGGRAIFHCADVTCTADCRRVVERTVEEFGTIHILFNNAGIIRRASVVEISEQDWDAVMSVNVKSIFLMSREIVPLMAKAEGGSIINTASGWGLAGGPRAAAYCASKGAVVLMTKAMAIDHGRQKIRVNCICPGRHRYGDAARRGAPNRRDGRTISRRLGTASPGSRWKAGRDRASRTLSCQ